MPRTSHRVVDLQLQVQEDKGFPSILYGSNQEEDMKSISLKPGFEYIIDLDPYGQISSEDFKAMSLEKLQCRLSHEVFGNSTHPIYMLDNCKFDCHVKLAFESCKCIPWDFVHKANYSAECDIFGRTCFFNKIEMLTHDSDDSCAYCDSECDWIRYKKHRSKGISLALKINEYSEYCNEYVCIDPTVR